MEAMIIRRLELEDFLSYRRTHIEFPEGSIAIVGENGAGKSSLLDAICFALYREAGRGGLHSLIRRGASRALVRLEFEVSGRRFLVEREIRRRARGRAVSDARLYALDGDSRKLLAYSPTQVDREVRRILGMDRQMFLTAVYVRQGEISRLLDVDPYQRKQLISKLLGVEELEKAYSAMALLIKQFELKLERERAKLAGAERVREELERLAYEEREIKRKIAEVERSYQRTLRELKEVGEKLKSRMEAVRKLEEIKRRAAILSERVQSLEAKRRELSELLSQAQAAKRELAVVEDLLKLERVAEEYASLMSSLEVELQRVEELELELRRAREASERALKLSWVDEAYRRLLQVKRKFEELTLQYTAKATELKSLEEQAKALLEECSLVVGRRVNLKEAADEVSALQEELERRGEELRRKLEALRSEARRVDALIAQLERWRAELEKAGDRCPLCGSPLPVERKEALLRLYSESLEELHLRARALNEKEEELSRELEGVEAKMKTASRLDPAKMRVLAEKIERISRERAGLVEELRRLTPELQALGVTEPSRHAIERRLRELEELRIEWARLAEHAKRVKELEERLKAFRSRVTALEERRRELASVLGKFGDPEEAVKLVREAKGKVELLRRIASSVNELRGALAELEEKLREAKSQLASLEKERERLGKLEEEVSELEERKSELIGRAQAAKRELELLYERLKNIRGEVERLKKELRELESRRARVRELERFIELLRRIRVLISKDGLQRELRARARPLVERHLRAFASLFELDLLDVKLNDDYEVLVVDSEGARSVDTVSGGEKVALALALRLAIAKALSGGRVGVMLLDEPTVHLDDVRRRRLVTAIRRLFGAKGNEFPQLVLVTHDSELEEAADVVLRVRKTATGSVVERATPVTLTSALPGTRHRSAH